MNHEPWIDQVYKEKMDAREIPMDMNHWKLVESMIIAEENKEKKKRFIFWFSRIGIVGMLAITTWGIYKFKHDIINSTPAPIPYQESPVLPIFTDVPTAFNPVTPKTSNGNITVPTESSSTLAKTNQARKTTSSRFNAATNKNSVASAPIDVAASIKPTIGQRSHIGEDSKSNINPTSQITSEANSNTFIVSQEKNADEKNQINQPISPANSQDYTVPSKSVEEVAMLDQLNPLLPEMDLALQLPSATIDEPIHINKPRWREQGIRMSLAKEALLNNTGIPISQAGIELYHQHSLGKHLFYGYGLGYNSYFNHTKYAQVIRSYEFKGFSADVNNFGVKPEWMHHVNMEGTVGIKWSKHRVMTGLRPALLIGAKGKVDQIRFKESSGIKDIANAEVSPLNQGWLKNAVLNPLALTIYVGYEYRILDKIGIGVQISHALASPYRPLDIGIKQSTSATWNSGFRFSYLLN